MVAIADINHPFRGMVRVMPTGFENAKGVMERFQAAQAGR
jgi:hypothetical protein